MRATDHICSHSESEDSQRVDSEASTHQDYELDEKNTEDKPEIAVKENSYVQRARLLVAIVLIVSVVGVAIAVFSYVENSERSTFEGQFEDEAFKVLAAIGSHLDRTLAALDALVLGIVSHARSTNQTFPFVTIPDFYLRVRSTIGLSDIFLVTLFPLVTPANRIRWEQYSIQNDFWVNETIKSMERDKHYKGPISYSWTPLPFIFQGMGPAPYDSNTSMLPMWQNAPVATQFPPYNWDRAVVPVMRSMTDAAASRGTTVLSAAFLIADPNNDTEVDDFLTNGPASVFQNFIDPQLNPVEPVSDIAYPVYDRIDIDQGDNSRENPVGYLSSTFYWRDIMRNILPNGANGLIVVISSPCNPSFTYEINGPTTLYVGKGDLHDIRYKEMMITGKLHELDAFSVAESDYNGVPLDKEYCPYTINIYPSRNKENEYMTSNPIIFACVAASIFLFTSLVFVVYDRMVEKRQNKVMSTAVKSTAVVSSLFPATVRDRLLEAEKENPPNKDKSSGWVINTIIQNQTQGYEDSERGNLDVGKTLNSAPIADLFPETTVMFADISGFTAWSSVREPSQVFTLLETVYSEFDNLARQHGVFKVETVGDCYVAVCGLPTPCRKHAVVMARFARDCRDSMMEMTRRLELTLGPGTANLELRIGLNSGPTVAGVLRGEKSRFQLFGDTMNTASRMESTGQKARIHISQKTADLLRKAGKENWLTPRDELVEAKGKGSMQTYWCEPTASRAQTIVSATDHSCGATEHHPDVDNMQLPEHERCIQRLVNWNVEILERLLRKVVAQRRANHGENTKVKSSPKTTAISIRHYPIRAAREEISETITLPEFDGSVLATYAETADGIPLPSKVREQLRDFVSVIAHGYRDNPFHNFEHASHVAMAATKMLSRIVNPHVKKVLAPKTAQKSTTVDKATLVEELHNSTFGITSDPLTHFALVFACLIHDLDHPGVPNFVLVKEEMSIAKTYNNLSIAEQNSVDIAWDILKQPQYGDLQACIFASQNQLRHFRQLVVNAVMATDIFDKELIGMRQKRWDEAFSAGTVETSLPRGPVLDDVTVAMNRRATIVLDYLIQAADVVHTMQHWAVFEKWNRCLFREMTTAFRNGRLEKDPSEGWYAAELSFFDNYVIPLAGKLKQCGVFGVSSDELLNYAKDNRLEWEMKGKALVQQWSNEINEA